MCLTLTELRRGKETQTPSALHGGACVDVDDHGRVHVQVAVNDDDDDDDDDDDHVNVDLDLHDDDRAVDLDDDAAPREISSP